MRRCQPATGRRRTASKMRPVAAPKARLWMSARRPPEEFAAAWISPALAADISEPALAADITDPALAAEPMLNADAIDPTDPIDRALPIDPMLSTDPVLAMESTESSEAMDHLDAMPPRCHASPVDNLGRPLPRGEDSISWHPARK